MVDLTLVNNLDDQDSFKNILGLSYRKKKMLQINPPRPLIEDLDSIPFPKRDDYSRYNEENHFAIITSRGCYGNCSFCSVNAFYGYDKSSWRIRSPSNIVDEIKSLVKNYDAKVISFMDDIFLGKSKNGKRRALELVNMIVDQGIDINFEISCRSDDVDKYILTDLKKAGLKHISIGIESGDNKILRRFNKRITVSDNIQAMRTLRNIGIDFTPYFIMFDPWITLDELKNNLHFLHSNNICTFQTVKNAITVYKGTPIYFQIKNDLKRKNWEYHYAFKDKNIEKIYFSLEELKELSEIDNLLIYYNFLKNSEFIEFYEDIIIQANTFTYNIMLNFIDVITNISSNNYQLTQMNTIKKMIHEYVTNIKNKLKDKTNIIFQR